MSKKLTTEKTLSPKDHVARMDAWAREKIKSAKPPTPVTVYVPALHSPEPCYRAGANAAFKCPSLVNGKRVAYRRAA